MSEKFSLQWNDFQQTVVSSFQELNESGDFTDVTLVTDDKTIEAHRFVLSACSPFFQNILKKMKIPHPFVYLKGIDGTCLENVLHFIYKGHVNVYQDKLEKFLLVGEELQLKGLTKASSTKSTPAQSPGPSHVKEELSEYEDNINTIIDENNETLDYKDYNLGDNTNTGDEIQLYDDISNNTKEIVEDTKKIYQNFDRDDYYEEFDRTVNSMMKKGENIWKCTQCDYSHKLKSRMRIHIEGKHNDGFSLTCSQCGKQFRSRHSLGTHLSRFH